MSWWCTNLIDCVHPTIAVIPPSLRICTRHRPCNVVDGDADEVLSRLAADEEIVLLERDEEDVNVEGWQRILDRVKVCDVLCERGALRRTESVGIGEDSPERHGCDPRYLSLLKSRFLLLP